MLALPPAPAPAIRRQVLVGTALFCAAGVMLIGAMTALWFHFRHLAGAGSWKPAKLVIPEVATNVMWITALLACLMIQWAVYSAKRGDRQHTAVAIGIVLVLGLAHLNSQAYVWRRISLPVKGDTAYNSMFYAITATLFVMVVIGVAYAIVSAFRYIGGRTKDRETLSGLALYWYFLAAMNTAVWFTVYVTK
jgi:heme/copper-type cytochrome/quinol oxidase subunit 3